MSRPDTAGDADSRLPAIGPVCDICGCFITDDDQQCPALDDGVCFP